MPELTTVGLAVVQGLTLFIPVGENLHLAVLPRLIGWTPQSSAQHIACHAGTVLALVVVLRREVWRLFRGAWQLLRGRWGADAKLAASVALALAPIGLLRLAGVAEYVGSLGIGRFDHLAMTGIALGVLMWLADRYSLAIRRLEHVGPADALALGLAQVVAYLPGAGLAAVSMIAARLLGFERLDAARLALLIGLGAFTGEVVFGGAHLWRTHAPASGSDLALAAMSAFLAGLVAVGFLFDWLRRGSFAPFALYRVLAGVATLVWFNFIFHD